MAGLRERLAIGDTLLNRQHIALQPLELGSIRIRTSANRDVERRPMTQHRQQQDADELAKPALQSIAIDDGVPVTWHDDANAREAKRGSEDAHVEVRGPY